MRIASGEDDRRSGDWRDASILVIDDEPINVRLLTKILREAGLPRVTSLTDPRKVLCTFAEVRPDVVLLDLHMPHMDGFEVMAALAPLLADDFVPVVVLTGDGAQATRERALSAGAKDFLSKPFVNSEVVLRVINLLESRAMYRGLRAHNSDLAERLRIREADDRDRANEWNRVVARVRRAMEPDGIVPVGQPVVELTTGATVGVEALSRFQIDPVRTPDVWFREASEVGLGVDLELAALGTAIGFLEDIPEHCFLALNMSPNVVVDPRLADILDGFPGDRIILEITEHSRIEDYVTVNSALDRLRGRGIRVAVDDAGAGFAGLQHILQLRPEVIKLDMALTRGIDGDPVRRALASCLLEFATDIGASLIAEGIETAGELDAMTTLGVTFGQGFHLGVPRRRGEPSTVEREQTP